MAQTAACCIHEEEDPHVTLLGPLNCGVGCAVALPGLRCLFLLPTLLLWKVLWV